MFQALDRCDLLRVGGDGLFGVRQPQATLRQLRRLHAGKHQVLIERGVEAAHELAELVHAEQGGDELALIARGPRGDSGEIVEAVLLDEAEAILSFVGLDGLRFARRRRRQDWRDVAAQASVVAVRPLVDPLGLRFADRTEHRHFQGFAEAALAGAVGTVDQGDVMAEVERLLPHESSKRPDFELVQSPERRPVFGAARVPVVGDRHLRQMRDGQRRQARGAPPACSTDLGQWLQVIEHQVRQPAHVVVHVPLRQVR